MRLYRCPLCPDSNQIRQRSEMTRCARKRHSEWVDVNSKVRFRSRNKEVLLLRGHRNRKSPTERRDDQGGPSFSVIHSERCGRNLLGLLFEGGSLRECPSDHKERVLARREKEGR